MDPKILVCKAVFHPDCIQPVLVHGIIPADVQELVFVIVEINNVLVRPFLGPVEVCVNGNMPIWCINCSSQFCVINNLLVQPSVSPSRSLMRSFTSTVPVSTPNVFTGDWLPAGPEPVKLGSSATPLSSYLDCTKPYKEFQLLCLPILLNKR
ncbi:hypothetical protein HGM15179_010605 [Zosterops borbonicus]|uniref:Uncharacterized protein n=1 Tax=Zosterops borbonicus TaxID=364589 RepID=A0A8K1GE90_9PASS|nr:hypothetical protein HGM15179_010605 [Zosterops borbonicus]